MLRSSLVLARSLVSHGVTNRCAHYAISASKFKKLCCPQNRALHYSTAFLKQQKQQPPPQDTDSQEDDPNKITENKTATQINIRETRSDIIEGSKIQTFIKKKEVGLTDDESTATGYAKAKTKDLFATLFAGGACVVFGYAIYTLWSEYSALG